jgi:protein O-mannosyl-transferase
MAKKRVARKTTQIPPSSVTTPEEQSAWIPIVIRTPLYERPVPNAVFIALAAIGVYLFSIQNQFVYFDDDKAILYQTALQNPSLRSFFTGQNLGMYAPLTWICYWFGYLLSGFDTWGYHLLSMLLHALNAVLVYFLLKSLFERHWMAIVPALLFAIHPIQVEAVAWAAALSTVLFSTFYLSALLSYVRWLRGSKAMWLGAALLFFLLSCLSKSAAVTLPLVIVTLDLYFQKPLRTSWWSKALFFALALGFGLYTFATREMEGHDFEYTSRGFNTLDRFFMVCHTLLFYPVKIVAPVGFYINYPFEKTNGAWSWVYYIAPVVLAALGVLVWRFRKNYAVLLGVALYFLPLTVMLPFRTVGSFELRSDRYMYLSCIGVFVLLALASERLKAPVRLALLAGVAGVLGFLAFRQTAVWKDGVALFGNCVANDPTIPLCQCNLAYNHLLNRNYDKAIVHYTETLRYDPTYAEAHNGRGNALLQQKQYQRAFEDFDSAIKNGIITPKIYLNRGKCLALLNRPAEALPDLNKSVEMGFSNPELFFLRGSVREKTGDTPGALEDYNKALGLNAGFLEAYVNRGMLHLNSKNYEKAISDLGRAIALSPNVPMFYTSRAMAYFASGDKANARADAEKALQLNPNNAKAQEIKAAAGQ